ncbi:hypothetical protein [Xanthomonas sp. NCPPB 2632]|uniref:hypothetical protein n=1 Tax=Xanthomonas sp. NCPPB 2632 TaxID=3240912 RepID=UPI0035162E65
MDAIPPNAPPAVVRATHQDAIDTVQRLIDTERWLIAQQDAMPAVPDTLDQGTVTAFLDQLDGFWAGESTAAEGAHVLPRRAALAAKLADALSDLATLRGLDGTLDDDTRHLVAAFIRPGGVAAVADIERREVTFADTPYAGTMLVTDTRHAGPVIAFTAARGWDRYPDLDHAHAAIETHVRRTLAWRADIPGIARGKLSPTLDPFVDSRATTEPAPVLLVDRFIAAQRDRIEQAWIEFELERSLPGRAQRFADRLREALSLTDLFDIEAILGVREARLRTAVENERLGDVPATLAADWRRSRAEYVDTLRFVTDRQAIAGVGPPPELGDYTVDQFGRVLRALGIPDDPHDITLTLDRSLDPSARFSSLTALFSGPEPLHASLIEAAYSNVPSLGADRFSAHGRDGKPIATLTDPYIRAIVNRLDIHSSYQARLTTDLRDGPDAALRRRAFHDIRAARMRHDAIDAQIAYRRGEHAGASHLGLTASARQRIDALLDAIAQGQPDAAGVHQVTHDDVPLRDVLEIDMTRGAGAVASAGESTLVYYTPDAPDGVAFRQFHDRTEAERLFFRDAAFRDYFLDRLPVESADTLQKGDGLRLNANRSLRWVFNGDTSKDGGQSPVSPGVKAIAGDPFDALYDTAFDHALRNVRALTRSTRDANREFLLDLWRRNPAHALPAQTAIATLTAPFRVAPAAWRAYDAIREGAYGDGFVDTTEGYVMALAAYSLGNSVLHASAAPYAVHFRAMGGALVSRAMARPSSGANRRYLAEGVTPTGQPDLRGMYRIDGRSYVAIGGKLYEANYHAPSRTVRLGSTPPLDAEAMGPPIRLQGELWQSDRRTAARQPAGRPATDGVDTGAFYSEYLNQLEQSFPDAIERELVAEQMYRELRRLPTRRIVTEAQRSTFNDAMARAEQVIRSSFDIGPSLPGRLRRVAEADLPERLWFYDEKPLEQSAFFGASNPGMDWAALRSEAQERDIFGVRLSSVPPEAPTHAIVDGSGIRRLGRGEGFAVELRVRDIVRGQGPGKGGVELLAGSGAQGNHYVLRTPPGRPVMLQPNQFQLIDTLPAPTN